MLVPWRGTDRDNRTSASGSRVRRPPYNVLACEQPVTPAEAAHMVERLQEEHCCLGVLDGVVAHTKLVGLFADIGEEFTVWTGPVGTELVENLCEGGGWHGDLTEMIKKGDLEVEL